MRETYNIPNTRTNKETSFRKVHHLLCFSVLSHVQLPSQHHNETLLLYIYSLQTSRISFLAALVGVQQFNWENTNPKFLKGERPKEITKLS